MRIKKNLFALAFAFFFFFTANASEDDSASLLTLGNDALDKGDFHTAIQHYEEAAKLVDSHAIHYNLGFAFYRMNALGKSIFHFRLANELNPLDADTKYNLEYARKSASDSVDGESGFRAEEVLNQYPLNLRESLWALAIATLWLSGISATLFFWRREWLVLLQRFSLAFWCVLAVGAGYRFYAKKDFGVVAVDSTDAYSGKGVGSVLLFSLHEGTEFFVKDQQEDWLSIVLADGKGGWILAKDAVYRHPHAP